MGGHMMFVVEGLTNFHGGESNVRRVGEFEILEDAIRAAKQIIDGFLMGRYKAGTNASTLFSLYQKSGEIPFIFSDEPDAINVSGFNHFEYAMNRCGAICKSVMGHAAMAGAR
jgi:hypothetical protein